MICIYEIRRFRILQSLGIFAGRLISISLTDWRWCRGRRSNIELGRKWYVWAQALRLPLLAMLFCGCCSGSYRIRSEFDGGLLGFSKFLDSVGPSDRFFLYVSLCYASALGILAASMLPL